jgi:hypothetical protein
MLPTLQENEIRILTLLPVPSGADQTSQVKCEIEVAPLSNLPQYEALSYVWVRIYMDEIHGKTYTDVAP